MKFNVLGELYEVKAKLPFSIKFSGEELVPIDLSLGRTEVSVANTLAGLTNFIDSHLASKKAIGAFGGYAEKRSLYSRSMVFQHEGRVRDIHLGLDFWLPEGTEVVAPLPGIVHSFADNNKPGDYGPTVILTHYLGNEIIHSLYGHLSRLSLSSLKVGQIIDRGGRVGSIGSSDENVDWPPHLHFQLIRDMEDKQGDYPGVCYEKDVDYYFENCPNPLVYFGHQWIRKLYKGVTI